VFRSQAGEKPGWDEMTTPGSERRRYSNSKECYRRSGICVRSESPVMRGCAERVSGEGDLEIQDMELTS
jgi:hypothetical protein